MRILGALLGLLAVYLFYSATLATVPTDSSYALGYNLGSHGAWIACAIGAYWLLKK